jgi:hypothetical protein
MSHQTAAVLLFCCFYSLWRLERGDWRPRGYLLAVCWRGSPSPRSTPPRWGSSRSRPTGSGPRPAARAASSPPAGLALAGVLPVALLLAGYHQAAFGHPLHSGYKYLNDAGYQGWARRRLPGRQAARRARLRALVLLAAARAVHSSRRSSCWRCPGSSPGTGRRSAGGCSRSRWRCSRSTPTSPPASATTPGAGPGAAAPDHARPLPAAARGPGRGRLAGAAALVGLVAGLVALSILSTCAMTFLDYIPDSLTNALYRSRCPSHHRALPQTWFSARGHPQPLAALPLLAAVIAAAAPAPAPCSPRGAGSRRRRRRRRARWRSRSGTRWSARATRRPRPRRGHLQVPGRAVRSQTGERLAAAVPVGARRGESTVDGRRSTVGGRGRRSAVDSRQSAAGWP